ncbi:hypothetical protein KDN32_06900 [Nocardioides sp. J2M5]|uniref:hypothetical protein n=1 Tax=Nocardioides palaemonis TaxID=2829810 RepID=UPI001BABD316|nr:hypothetical protein [Nocardioides palaemonis]MBS2937466.1 hypothetical protein [Nocardioides palaemonis]
MRRTTAAALVAALATGLGLVAPAGAAAPTTELQPQRLDRGPDVAVAHVEDFDFVAGDLRVDLAGRVVRVIGESGDGWVVGTDRRRVIRIEPDGSTRTLLRKVDVTLTTLSEDGSRLVTLDHPARRRTAVQTFSALDGSAGPERTFGGWPEVVTADERQVLVRHDGRLVRWRTGPDRVRLVTRRLSALASIEHDLLETYTKDPYVGGCVRMVRLSDLADTVWRSCSQRVVALSPDGTRMLTVGILVDGLGPNEIDLRRTDGKRLATWTTNWFGGWQWESPDAVLLQVNGQRKSSTVRCVLDACENASDPVKVQMP